MGDEVGAGQGLRSVIIFFLPRPDRILVRPKLDKAGAASWRGGKEGTGGMPRERQQRAREVSNDPRLPDDACTTGHHPRRRPQPQPRYPAPSRADAIVHQTSISRARARRQCSAMSQARRRRKKTGQACRACVPTPQQYSAALTSRTGDRRRSYAPGGWAGSARFYADAAAGVGARCAVGLSYGESDGRKNLLLSGGYSLEMNLCVCKAKKKKEKDALVTLVVDVPRAGRLWKV